MDIEILTIGDELLRGELLDTNGCWLTQQLVDLGGRVRRMLSIGDASDEIVTALTEASSRCGILITTGGLGPTEDDRTAEAAARAAGVQRELDEAALAAIRARFDRARLPFSANNERQARLPAGAEPLPNERGTAPGFALQLGHCRVFCLPGVPSEMRWMFETYVQPWVERALGDVTRSRRVFKLFGLGESQVDEKLDGLLEQLDAGCEASLHYRATFPEVHVTLVARGSDRAVVQSVAARGSEEIVRRLGRNIFACGDESFSEVVVAELRAARATVALAESCSGGLVGDLLTRAPGASDVFELGLVTYANRFKQQLLQVPAALLEREGAVSKACVEAMAKSVRAQAGATYGVAVSGIAGPEGGSTDKPVGTVHFALAKQDGVRHLSRVFPYGRQRNKLLSGYVALWLLLDQLRNGGPLGQGDPFAGRWSGERGGSAAEPSA